MTNLSSPTIANLIKLAAQLRDQCDSYAQTLLEEGAADYIYNPLYYAWDVHKAYVNLAGGLGAKTILLGMNPGPHGMGQMGIPFAAASMVRDLLGIKGIPVKPARRPHPKRTIVGLSYPKEEVSGTRLWGLLKMHYGDAEGIFKKVFIVNHCPLMFLNGPRATNITPDKISGSTNKALLADCDAHLKAVVDALGATQVIGVGRFAEGRAKKALKGMNIDITTCWHPSPASPLANKNGGADWRANVRNVLP